MKMRIEVVLLLLVLAIGLLYWGVSLATPVVFGDEGFYAAMARSMLSTGIIPKLQTVHGTDIFHYVFARPPLFFMLDMAALALGGELLLKALLPLPIALASIMLFLLLRRLGKPVAGLVAAGALLLLPGIVTYGVMNYVETLSLLFFISSLYFADVAFRDGGMKDAVLSGTFAGLALLTEASAFWLPPLLIGYALLTRPIRFRRLLMILVIAAVIVSPWLVRNVVLFGGHCNYIPAVPDLPGAACSPFTDVKIDDTVSVTSTSASGQDQNLSAIGLLSYSSFAFGWSAAALFMFGIAALAASGRARTLFGLWLVAFFAMTVLQANAGRAEDTVRNTLFGFPAMAAAIGLFASGAYDWMAKDRRWLSVVLVAVVLLALFPFGYGKITTMQTVKHGLDGLVEGCDWVKANTPADSVIYAIYGHQAAWRCDRSVLATVPDADIIRLGSDANVTYSHLRLHGFDYVMIEQFTVSYSPTGEQNSVSFVNVLEGNPDLFKKVYDNTAKWGQAGVRVFRVL